MSSFPLYDVLITTVQSQTISELKSTEKNKLIKCIQTLDQDGKNKIYALIRYYGLNQSENSEIIPFGGYSVNDELIFDLERFPLELQYILLEFTKLHSKHMKDNQKFEKLRKKN